ncbi:MAG: hypothetical protein MR270_03130 [Erysipelotrichaceae bacterium]|nr:hypothetical protein [Erysipelotrichaceae bacterium]
MELIISDKISIIVKLNDEVSFEEMDNEGFFYNEKNEKLIVANITALHIYNFIMNNIKKV